MKPIVRKWTDEENELLLSADSVDTWVDSHRAQFKRSKSVDALVSRWKFRDILKRRHDAAQRKAKEQSIAHVVIAETEGIQTPEPGDSGETKFRKEFLSMTKTINNMFVELREMHREMRALQSANRQTHSHVTASKKGSKAMC
jgi:hypothetical protein